jgi:hypothetical protein
VEERGFLHSVGWNVNYYGCYGKQYGGSTKKLKIKPPYDLTIPLGNIQRK